MSRLPLRVPAFCYFFSAILGFETFSSSLVIFLKRTWKLLSYYQDNDLLSVKYFCLKELDWVSN